MRNTNSSFDLAVWLGDLQAFQGARSVEAMCEQT